MADGDHRESLQLRYPKLSHYFTRGVTILLALKILGLVVSSYAPNWTGRWLVLHPSQVIRGDVWLLVTYSFVNGPWSIIFGGLGLVLCGSMIERQCRTKSLIVLWLVVGIACGIIWTLVGLLVGVFSESFLSSGHALGWSSGSCVYGILGAFAFIFRRQKAATFFLVMEAQHLILIL